MIPAAERFYREKKPSAVEEAVAFTATVHNGLSSREREVARTAAKAAVRWAKREVAETVQALCADAD